MRYLVLSDIHSNWEALETAVAAVDGRYDQVICCGDVVGYGADPNRATEWVREHCQVVVRGNHDKAGCGLTDAREFNAAAQAAALWTRRTLTPENLAWLRDLPVGPALISDSGSDFQIVHGSLRDEDEYLVGAGDATAEFEHLPYQVTFFGHTHVQGGFVAQGKIIKALRPYHNSEVSTLTLDIQEREKYLLNPGSIGQPRDGDPRAALVIYTPGEKTLEYWRIPYDIAKAQQQILEAGLPEVLAQRLSFGR
jgi:predicted phosphodiesterase